jgi:hypothetical protein
LLLGEETRPDIRLSSSFFISFSVDIRIDSQQGHHVESSPAHLPLSLQVAEETVTNAGRKV